MLCSSSRQIGLEKLSLLFGLQKKVPFVHTGDRLEVCQRVLLVRMFRLRVEFPALTGHSCSSWVEQRGLEGFTQTAMRV